MCEPLSKDAVCRLCSGAGLLQPGYVCPLCTGRGHVPGSDLIEKAVRAISRAAVYYGGPAALTLDELRQRWRSPAPDVVRMAIEGCEDARACLRAAGLACRLESGSIQISLLAEPKREEPS